MSKTGRAFWNWEGHIGDAMQKYGKILTDMPNDEFIDLAEELTTCRKKVGSGPGTTDVQIKKYELLTRSEEVFKKLATDRNIEIPQLKQ